MDINAIFNAIVNAEMDSEPPRITNFPIYLAIELEEDWAFRIVYWKNDSKVIYGHEIVVYDLESDFKHQKKFLVKHIMERLKFKFAFGVSDKLDRYYIKKISTRAALRKKLEKIYTLVDEQIGITDLSAPKSFFI